MLLPPAETDPILGYLYGDNPEDSKQIKAGFKYYDVHKKELIGN